MKNLHNTSTSTYVMCRDLGIHITYLANQECMDGPNTYVDCDCCRRKVHHNVISNRYIVDLMYGIIGPLYLHITPTWPTYTCLSPTPVRFVMRLAEESEIKNSSGIQTSKLYQ